ncbi:PREDICTED: uncharacterized protein LOC106811543 [Priapulus caudatus]|uniref:Uncharacterized protein LOC106811543 n=1 Tax=Priapulus caudatus TaxID=37621 RepID=A0ABM1EES6_PRICU|nr:PREDICTED: uncharacterized protein LOC106811543 [Priapulus caudatus]
MKVDQKTVHEFGVLPKNHKLPTFSSQESTSSDISCPTLNPSRTVSIIAPVLDEIKSEKGSCPCTVLMVGCGQALDKVIDEANKRFKGTHQIVAAATDYDCILSADEYDCFVIHWDPQEFEQELISITENICCGSLDVIVLLEPCVRSLKRCLNCLKQGGTVITARDANVTASVRALASKKQQIIMQEL